MTSPAIIRPAQPVKLYRYPLFGHSHRVELFLSLLDLPVESIDVDLAAGAQKAPAYLEMNPFSQVPVIRDGEVTLADSNAILVYLASKYADEQWLPRKPARAAAVQRRLSVAAGLVAFGPATARLTEFFKAPFNADEVIGRANGLFAVMEKFAKVGVPRRRCAHHRGRRQLQLQRARAGRQGLARAVGYNDWLETACTGVGRRRQCGRM